MKSRFKFDSSGMTRPLGQGLLETIVAINVFLTGAISAVALIIASVNAGRQSAKTLVASALAAEGIEAVKKIRDSNYLAGAAWDQGLKDVSATDLTAIAVFDPGAGLSFWTLDFSVNSLADPAAQLFLDNQVYRQSIGLLPGEASGYYRMITIDPKGTDFMKEVRSQVLWLEKGSPKSVKLETKIYNWRAL